MNRKKQLIAWILAAALLTVWIHGYPMNVLAADDIWVSFFNDSQLALPADYQSGMNKTTNEDGSFSLGPIKDSSGRHYVLQWGIADSGGNVADDRWQSGKTLNVGASGTALRDFIAGEGACYVKVGWGACVDIRLDAKNGTAVNTLTKIQESKGDSFTIDFPTPDRSGYFFDGWLCTENNASAQSSIGTSYAGGTALSVPFGDYGSISAKNEAVMSYEGQWTKAKSVKIAFAPNGGTMSGAASREITQSSKSEDGFTITTSGAPVRDGYVFKGWLCSGDNKIYAQNAVTASFDFAAYDGRTITFTAQWEQEKTDNTDDKNNTGDKDNTDDKSNTDNKNNTDDKDNTDNNSNTDDKNNSNAPETISKGGTYQLKAKKMYKLGSGSWTVGSDGCIYKGNSTFYVAKDGSYTLTKK